MAMPAKRSKVLMPIAAFAAGMLVASAVGATAKTNAGAPGKLTVGPFGTTEVDPDPLGQGDCTLAYGQANGIRVGDRVIVQAPEDLEGVLVATPSEQTDPDYLRVRICNIDDVNASVDGDPRTWSYAVVR